MADAVVVTVLKETKDELLLHLTNVSDGTGEAAVAKTTKANLLDRNGAVPAALDIQYVRWAVQGFPRVVIAWDHTAPDTALVLAANGAEKFIGMEAGTMPFSTVGLRDPGSAGGTGDIKVTAPASAATGSYDITLSLYKRPAVGG